MFTHSPFFSRLRDSALESAVTISGGNRLLRPTTVPLIGTGSVVILRTRNSTEDLRWLTTLLSRGVSVALLSPHTPEKLTMRLIRALEGSFQSVFLDDRNGGELIRVAEASHPRTWDQEPRIFIRSGGTDGKHKMAAIAMDERSVSGMCLALDDLGYGSSTREILVLPLHHAAGLVAALCALHRGHTLYLQGTFNAAKTIQNITELGVDWAVMAPTHMRSMMQEPSVRQLSNSGLTIVHTGEACELPLKKAWMVLLGADHVGEFYSSTEQLGMTLIRGTDWVEHPGSVGRGYMTMVAVRDDSGREVLPRTVGTVYMRRALKGQSSDFATLGDTGYLDDQGFLYLEPRRVGMFTVGGENIYPAEIEAALLFSELVVDVRAYPVPNPRLGNVVELEVVSSGGGIEAIRRYCEENLAASMRPRVIKVVSAIHRSEQGKIIRRSES